MTPTPVKAAVAAVKAKADTTQRRRRAIRADQTILEMINEVIPQVPAMQGTMSYVVRRAGETGAFRLRVTEAFLEPVD